MFVHCKSIQLLWDLVENWLKRNCIPKHNFTLTKRMKLLGTLKRDSIPVSFGVCDILFQCRILIHQSNINEKMSSFVMFLKYSKKEITLEKIIMKAENKCYETLHTIDHFLWLCHSCTANTTSESIMNDEICQRVKKVIHRVKWWITN